MPPSGPLFAPAVVRAAANVAALRAEVAAAQAAGGRGPETCALASDLLDRIVNDVWQSLVEELGGADAPKFQQQVALVAHGGYGRRERAPFSDVDLMILHEPAATGMVAPLARRLLQDLFDAGMEVGQSVRTVSEAVRLASGDATIFSSLIDLRTLAGNPLLSDRLSAGLKRLARRVPQRLVTQLLEARREERDRYGQSVSLLEPNVKRSPGGLRDIQLVHWLQFVQASESAAAAAGVPETLTWQDAERLREAADFLMTLRIDLHLHAGRCADDLTRDEQVRVARQRGIADRGGVLGVERFMRDYFHHTGQVAHIVRSTSLRWRQPNSVQRWVEGLFGQRVDGLFLVGPQAVGVLPEARDRVAGSLSHCLRLVELSQVFGKPIDHATWEAVRAAAGPVDRDRAELPADAASALEDETRARFLALFDRPERLAEALRRLHEVGLLEQIIPEFRHARHLLQFNNYHKYTVDEHCLVAVERGVALGDEEGWLTTVWRQIRRKRPLLLALLIHDLGKGFVEDHSEIGARMARDVAARLMLPEDEARIVEFLVHRHLAMAHLAFRRDVDDPSLLVRFAVDVGSPEVLQMLAVLTAADVSAVGPGVWTRWKADLLGELYFRTLAYLDGESPSAAADRHRRGLDRLLEEWDPDDEVVRLARQLPSAYLRDTQPQRMMEELLQLAKLPPGGVFVGTRWQSDTSTVAITVGTSETVASGIFHRLTGGLTSQRLEILAADIHTLENGLVIDHFVVRDPDFVGEPPAERMQDIAAAIRSSLKADRAPTFARRLNPLAPRTNPAALKPVRVLCDNESSERSTIIEVFAHDSEGLLYCISRALYEAELSVSAAKIGTYLDQVVDAFHVTDRGGQKVTDPERLETVRRALEKAVAPAKRL